MTSVAKKAESSEERRQAAFAAWHEFKEQVKDIYRIDTAIEEFSGTSLDGRPGGDRKGKCPFHNDTNPSMSVRAGEGYFKCQTAGCEAKGDVFKFISEYLGVSFKQAVLLAAEKVGIEPPNGAADKRWKGANNAAPKPRSSFENQMNPAKLFESDLSPAFKGIRPPKPGAFFPVWHPGGGRTITPCVKKYKAEMVHVYRNMSRQPIMAVLRCLHREGGKYFMPIRIGTLPKEAPGFVVDDKENRRGWLVKGTSAGHRKPIYGMEAAMPWMKTGGTRVLIVEGEKTCEATKRMITGLEDADNWLTLSPMGGHNASLYADWTEFMSHMDQAKLDKLSFAVWPDADHIKTRPDGTEIDAQMLYVRDTIGAFVTAARKAGLDPTKVSFSRALPGFTRENGWDLADAETEGWDGERVRLEIDERGAKMPIEKRFLDLEVDINDADDPAPFEDGPEAIYDLELSDHEHEDNGFSVVGETEVSEESFVPDADEIAELLGLDDETPSGKNEAMVSEVAETYVIASKLLKEETAGSDAAEILDRPIQANDLVESDAEDIKADAGGEGDDDGNDDGLFVAKYAVMRNTNFRCLGYRDGTNYIMSLRSGQIFAINYAAMRKQALFSIAPIDFWAAHFTNIDRGGKATIEWDNAISALIDVCYDCGYWDPTREAGQGARIDGGRVVFNSGDRLWIQKEPDGPGVVDIAANFNGDYQYTVGDSCRLPAFDNIFQAGDEEPLQLLELIRKINWREETSHLSVMALFGWLCIGPICGVLPWRPHLWLDGQRAAGKSWIIEKLIAPCLGDYAMSVKSNSTESGLRNMLHGRAFPLVFDEAEGEQDGDRNRMGAIMRLARHSSTPGDSVVAQGVPGGNGQKFFSIASTFLLASITPQIESSADKTRFARAKLGPGHNSAYFSREIEQPALNLLTPEFSSRMIARMVTRASSMINVQAMMVRGLTACGIERRLADVWGTFAAGAWLLLEDGVPEDHDAAMEWIEDTFKINSQMQEFAAEIGEDKDHSRLFRSIISHEVRCETLNLGARNFTLGSVLNMAIKDDTEGDEVLDRSQASKRLADMGIRLGHQGELAKDGDEVDCVFIHKNSPRLSEILARTPYATSYVDVIQQAEDVKNGPPVRFGGLGIYRSVCVPIKHFGM
jgi:putative DNA primase/helicase